MAKPPIINMTVPMDTFERLLAIADQETLEMVRTMIGKPELALLIAKEAAFGTTSENLSPTKVAEVLGITPQSASKKVDATGIRKSK
jgi:hypothetical protein